MPALAHARQCTPGLVDQHIVAVGGRQEDADWSVTRQSAKVLFAALRSNCSARFRDDTSRTTFDAPTIRCEVSRIGESVNETSIGRPVLVRRTAS